MAADAAGGGGYERQDADVRTLAWLLAGLLTAALVALGLMDLLYRHFASREARRQPPPTTLAGTRNSVPPEPRLQNTPFEDLHKLRAEEDAALASYGWVDRRAGIVRIPIEKAMEMAWQGGLGASVESSSPKPSAGGKR